MGVITTSRQPDENKLLHARQLADHYSLTYIPRKNCSISSLLTDKPWVLVVDSRGLSCHTGGGVLFFHPNMAAVRLRQLKSGQTDKMLLAMGLEEGQSMLDCTAGLCSDSLVAAWQTGEKGRVVALEQSLPVFLVVKTGLEQVNSESRFAAMAGRIELKHQDFRNYLDKCPANSFDVVYFDPMFDVPVDSASMAPLRPLAGYLQLTSKDIQAAARVARCRVVVKQRSFYDFSHLGLNRTLGSRSRTTAYGILDL